MRSEYFLQVRKDHALPFNLAQEVKANRMNVLIQSRLPTAPKVPKLRVFTILFLLGPSCFNPVMNMRIFCLCHDTPVWVPLDSLATHLLECVWRSGGGLNQIGRVGQVGNEEQDILETNRLTDTTPAQLQWQLLVLCDVRLLSIYKVYAD